jgi:hypothetical protein
MRPSLSNDAVPQKDEPIVDVGDMGFVHIQRQFQAAFQESAAFSADCFCMCLCPLDDDDKVIGIAARAMVEFG